MLVRHVLDKRTGNRKNRRGGGAKPFRRIHKLSAGQMTALTVIVVALSVCVMGGGLWIAFLQGNRMSQTAQLETVEETETEGTEDGLLAQESAGEAEEPTEEESETETQPEEPEVYVELTEENRKGFVTVEACEIRAGSGSFELRANVEEKPASDDNNFYLDRKSVV